MRTSVILSPSFVCQIRIPDSLTGNQSNELHVAVVVKSFALSFVPDPTQGGWYDRRSFRRVFVIISHERALVIASLTFGRNGQDLWS
jgi:hypothetical protein